VPTWARMPLNFDNNEDDSSKIIMMAVQESTDQAKTQEATAATLGCANTGESCWNGVACCSGNMCSEGPYNSVCVEIVYPPPGWGPWNGLATKPN